MRRILIEDAKAISKNRKDSKLKRFFMSVMARSGKNVTVVAFARKVLCILHHLLMKREDYQDLRRSLARQDTWWKNDLKEGCV
jgi:transposase